MNDSGNLSPSLFDPAAIDPETARFNQQIEEMLSTLPPTHTFTPQEVRAAREAGRSFWGPIKRLDRARNRVIPGRAGDLTLRIFTPKRANGVFLHIHGGGFVVGRVDHYDEALAELADRGEVAVVSVDYRLAPEDPYPAGLDDCEVAAVWLAEKARSEFGSGRLLIGGESAGASLSALTLLRMRDRHGFTGFSGAILTFGAYDLTMTPSVRLWGERNLVLTTRLIEWFNDHYVPEEKRMDPDVSPLYAELSEMPPALFTVGTLDPLLDDTLFMHARWLAAGNAAELAVYPGGIHAFNAFPTGLARQANERVYDFVRNAFTEPS